MPYADTDFFLALLKESDWLRDRALRIYHKNKGNITTSVTTVIELLLLAERLSIDPERLLAGAFEIAPNIRGITINTALVAAHYIKDKGLNVFDAFHAAYCENNPIISSDHIFDTIGIERIKLEKEN